MAMAQKSTLKHINQPLHSHYKNDVCLLKTENNKSKGLKHCFKLLNFAKLKTKQCQKVPITKMLIFPNCTLFKLKQKTVGETQNTFWVKHKTNTDYNAVWACSSFLVPRFEEHERKTKFKTRNWQCRLKNCTSITGFKKGVYNALKVSNAQLVPAYNRRKHKLSHINLINHQINRLSKTFGYIRLNKINAWIGLTLTQLDLSYQVGLLVPKNGLVKQIEQNVSAKVESVKHFVKQTKNQKPNTLQKITFGQNKSESFSKQATKQLFKLIIRNVPSLIALIESESFLVYWKNNVFKSLNATKQALRHKQQLIKVDFLKQTQNNQFKLKKVNACYAWLKIGEVLRQ